MRQIGLLLLVILVKSCGAQQESCLSLSPAGIWIPTGTGGFPACSQCLSTSTNISTAAGQCCLPNPPEKAGCLSLSPPGYWIGAGVLGGPDCSQCGGTGPTAIPGPPIYGVQCCQQRTPQDICQLPKKQGTSPCNAIVERYYYDWNEGRCLPFEFRGCTGGNANNFVTVDECNNLCGILRQCSSLSPPGFWIPAALEHDNPTCAENNGTYTGIFDDGGQCCQPDPQRQCSSLSPPGFWIPAGPEHDNPTCAENEGTPTGIIHDGGQCCQPDSQRRCSYLSPHGFWIVAGTRNAPTCSQCGGTSTDIYDDGGQCCLSEYHAGCLFHSPPGFWIEKGTINALTCSQCGGIPADVSGPVDGGQCCQPSYHKRCSSLSPPGFWIGIDFPGASNCSEHGGIPTDIFGFGGQCCQPDPQKCGGFYRNNSGVIVFPQIGGQYDNNEHCVWIIETSGSHIELKFAIFSTELHYDSLIIRDGNNAGSPLIGSFSGNTISKITTGTGQAYLSFTSDGTIGMDGFTLLWNTLDCIVDCPTDPFEKQVCASDGTTFKTFNSLCDFNNSKRCNPVDRNMTLQHDENCICQLQMVQGKGFCEIIHTGYYYNWDERQCLPFSFVGCTAGNANFFETYDECSNLCGDVQVVECPSPWVLVGSQCFLLVVKEEEWRNWASAHNYCSEQAPGADVAQPKDLKLLATYIIHNIQHDSWLYLGGSDLSIEGSWEWNNGTAITEGWRAGEPNDGGDGEDCLSIEPSESADLDKSLIDRDCGVSGPFVCELQGHNTSY